MMFRNALRHLGLLCTAAALVPGALHSQSTTQGAIAGTVFDATDAAIPNASVKIHSDGTNADMTLKTDSSGYFKAPQLTPGTYTVSVTATGFGEVRTSNVIVQVNDVTEVTPHLTAGAESQVVEVTAEVPVLKFDSPSYGGQLSNQEIENIPINNRRWSSLSLLTPGVTNDTAGFGLISFRAISATLNNVQIDGADDNQAFYGEERGRTRAGYSTAQTAIREFQVNTGVYSAEFGRAVGGVVNSVTKTGTNQLHGELYFYHRDQQWSASNPFVRVVNYDSTSGIAQNLPFKAKDKRNQYGLGFGGPLIKNKLFFFYSFDQYRRVFPGTAVAGNTSFYSPLATDYSTFTTRYNTATNSNLSAAQGTALYNNFIGQLNGDLGPVTRFGYQIINTPRLDWQITPKHTASILYHRLRWDSPGGVQTQQSNNYARDSFGTDFVKLDYTLAKLNSIITNKIVNELRYQYGRELNNEGRQTPTDFTNQYLTPGTGVGTGVPVQVNTVAAAFTLGTPYYSFRYALPDERKWQVGDTMSVLLGKNNLKFGIDFLHNNDLQNALGFSTYPGNGAYNYGAIRDLISDLAVPTRGACGTRNATTGVYTAVGCYTNYRSTVSATSPTTGAPFQSTFEVATQNYGFFAQDDWKVSPTLTLNLGARYEYQKFPPPFANLVNNNFAGSQNTPSDKNNVGPRFGFAWDPFAQGKTVVRGGFGMYYGQVPVTGILSARFYTGSPNGQLAYTFAPTASGAPLLPIRPAGTAFGSTTPDLQYLDSRFQNPYTEQFDLAIQQNLGLNTILSLSYLGALGRELPNSLNLNLDPSKTYNVNYTVTNSAGLPTGSCGPLACGTTFSQKVYSLTQVGSTTAPTLNPAYGSIYAAVSNVNSNFHAVTVSVTKRAGKFISYDANYTWSHALDYNQTQITGYGQNSWFDPYGNTRANYGNSSLNVRHRAVGWAILNVPGTKGIRFVDAATNGWSIKPAFQMQSGLPYSATLAGANPTAQCVGTGCLSANAAGLSGTGVTYLPIIGRNTLQYPRDILLDLRIQKDFKLTERFNLQFLGEAFNVANHQNVTSINTQAYSLTRPATAPAGTPATAGPSTATLQFQNTSFGAVQNSNNNFAYGPRTIQAGARLFF